jgi:hypothetical protein
LGVRVLRRTPAVEASGKPQAADVPHPAGRLGAGVAPDAEVEAAELGDVALAGAVEGLADGVPEGVAAELVAGLAATAVEGADATAE